MRQNLPKNVTKTCSLELKIPRNTEVSSSIKGIFYVLDQYHICCISAFQVITGFVLLNFKAVSWYSCFLLAIAQNTKFVPIRSWKWSWYLWSLTNLFPFNLTYTLHLTLHIHIHVWKIMSHFINYIDFVIPLTIVLLYVEIKCICGGWYSTLKLSYVQCWKIIKK